MKRPVRKTKPASRHRSALAARAARTFAPGSAASRTLLAAVCGIALFAPTGRAFAAESDTAPKAFDGSGYVTIETIETQVLEADLPGEELAVSARDAAALEDAEALVGSLAGLRREGMSGKVRVKRSVEPAFRETDLESQGGAEGGRVAEGRVAGESPAAPSSDSASASTLVRDPAKSTAAQRAIVTVGPDATVVHDVPYEILLSARNNFRALASSSAGRIAADERYVGSLLAPLSAGAPLFPGERAPLIARVPADPRRVLDTDEDPAKFESEKVYTVVDGHIVEVAQVDVPLEGARADVKPPEGFVVAVEDNGTRTVVTSDSKEIVALPVSPQGNEAAVAATQALSQAGGGAIVAAGTVANATPSGRAFSVPDGANAFEELLGPGGAASLNGGGAKATPVPGSPSSGGAASGREFQIPDALKDGGMFGLGEQLAFDAPSSGRSLESASTPKSVTVRGRVTVPRGTQASAVVLRIAGTGWQIQPDADGQFEFRDMPFGSRFEIMAWDVNNALTRRLVPVTASGDSDVSVVLEPTSFVDDLASGFGVRQESLKSGFCALLDAGNKDLLIGARVTVRATQAWQGPYFFNESHLPDARLSESSRDGRFCVFNVESELVDVDVRLLNGTRRTFSIHAKPTFFETSLSLDVGAVAYRPAMPLELVDAFEAFDSSISSRRMRFGTLSTRRWLRGEESAAWARVYGLKIRTDGAYGAVSYEEGNAGAVTYLPLGQEFQEIRFARDEESAPEAHALVSRSELLGRDGRAAIAKAEASGKAKVVVDAKDPLPLRVMDADTLEDLARTEAAVDVDPAQGAAFVSLDLSRIDVDYADVRLSLRDVWTGQSVAPFHFVKPAGNAKNPRQVRGFFTNVPSGQYTLLVTDKAGALRWIDVVRARPGSLQVISIGE